MTKRIMVADDEPSILRSTELLLADLGFAVVTTSDPQTIPFLLAEEKIDLLLQDVRMPGLDLDQLVNEIRQNPAIRHIPVLLFSASIDLDTIRERVGAAGVVEKPFRPIQMREAIEAFTGG